MATVNVNGQPLTLAPLRSLQVAAFMEDAKDIETTSTVAVIRRSLSVVAQSLANAGSAQGTTPDEAIENLNGAIAYQDLDPAFRDVMDLTGIKLRPEPPAGDAQDEATAVS